MIRKTTCCRKRKKSSILQRALVDENFAQEVYVTYIFERMIVEFLPSMCSSLSVCGFVALSAWIFSPTDILENGSSPSPLSLLSLAFSFFNKKPFPDRSPYLSFLPFNQRLPLARERASPLPLLSIRERD
uniref:Uncharacterized protein n=1 Tax=Utricularia reniformis TaxID=192314 RepID=A0A1Y0AYY0_9LAMI|nr:hypothetical protein AEK19_MT1220 [Utricularia reniformis]ART30357.1 hypothetical protein AEK19_MT1220 [Utricularia reniformis]